MKPEELEIKRVSFAELRDIERFIGMPKPPTYSFTGAGGAKAIMRHSKDTLQDEADLEAWESYQTQWKAFIERRDMIMVGLAVTNCPPPSSEWIEEDKKKAWATLPEIPEELVGYYIMREICKSPQEYDSLIERILSESGFFTSEEVAAKVAGFPDTAGKHAARNSS